MSLIEEYGQRKEEKGIQTGIKKGQEMIIKNMLKEGHPPQNIAMMTKIPLSVINKVKLKNNL